MEELLIHGGEVVTVPSSPDEWRALTPGQLDDVLAKLGGDSTMSDSWHDGQRERARREGWA